MADVNNYDKVQTPEDEAERCWGQVKTGPCPNKRVHGSEYCLRHGGTHAKRRNAQEELRMYRLGQYQQRVGELSSHADMKSLAGEIGIIRMTLEEVILSCTDKDGNANRNQLLVQAPQINQLAITVKSLVESLQKIQERNNLLLDKKQIMSMADGIIKILTTHITDAETLAKVGMEVQNVIEKSILIEDPAGSAT